MTSRLACGLAAVLLTCWTAGAQQQTDRRRTEALAERATERLRSLHEEAARLANEESSLLNELQRLEVGRQITLEEFRQADLAAGVSAKELSVLDAEIQRLERQAQSERPELAARLVELYKLGQARYLRLLLSTADLRHVGQASRMVAALAGRDQARIASHQRLLAELTASRIRQSERQTRLAELRALAASAKIEADRAIAARNEMIHRIDQQRDLNAQLAGELQGAQTKLQSLLTGLTTGAQAGEVGILPLRPFRGALEWPVSGVLRSGFGQYSAVTATPARGIDIAAAERSPVRAVHDGTVAFADTFVGLGRLVIVDHSAQTFTLYGNLSEVTVVRGTRVEHGQVVGAVGVAPTGAAGLYFELRVDGRPVDPLQWLKKR